MRQGRRTAHNFSIDGLGALTLAFPEHTLFQVHSLEAHYAFQH